MCVLYSYQEHLYLSYILSFEYISHVFSSLLYVHRGTVQFIFSALVKAVWRTTLLLSAVAGKSYTNTLMNNTNVKAETQLQKPHNKNKTTAEVS